MQKFWKVKLLKLSLTRPYNNICMSLFLYVNQYHVPFDLFSLYDLMDIQMEYVHFIYRYSLYFKIF